MAASMQGGVQCRICWESLSKKDRRSIFSSSFHCSNQLSQVLDYQPQSGDSKSAYICQRCFCKLNKLSKIEYDICHKVTALQSQRRELLAALRDTHQVGKERAPNRPTNMITPRKDGKRLLLRSPTPRKVKARVSRTPQEKSYGAPSQTDTGPQVTQSVSQTKSKKRLQMGDDKTTSATASTTPMTPGKVKVIYRAKKSHTIISKTLKDTKIREIVKSLAKGNSFKTTGQKILWSPLLQPILDVIVKQISESVVRLCARDSVLYQTSSDKLQEFEFEEFNSQFKEHAPFLFRVINTLSKDSPNINTMIMAILLRCRNNHLARLHHIIAQVLDSGGATDETIQIMAKLGLSVGPSALSKKRIQLEDSQKASMRLVLDDKVEHEKINKLGKSDNNMAEVKNSQIIGDNVDITRNRSQMTKDRQRDSWHWFLLVGVKNRVSFPDLPDDTPLQDISAVDNSMFILSANDRAALDENFIFHIMHVLIKYMPCFKDFDTVVPKHILHPYIKETSSKSEYAILDLLNKSENINDEMICILKHIHENYLSHTDEEDPSVIKRKVFGGDVLTNERAYEGQLAMLNSPTDFTRLQGVIHRPEGLHRMMNLLLFIYQRFHNEKSATDGGTLYQLRNVMGRLDVRGGKKTIESFRAHLSFVEDVLDSYVVGACLHMLGLENLEHVEDELPGGSMLNDTDKLEYLRRVAEDILSLYVKNTRDLENLKESFEELSAQNQRLADMYDTQTKLYVCSTCGKKYKVEGWFKKHLITAHEWVFECADKDKEIDHIAMYRSSFMKCALILRDTKDAFKMGDGDRILRNAKCEMVLADVGGHTKYRLWLFRFIAYCISLLTPRQAMEYKWNCTSSTTGGIDNNIPNDNLVEIFVQLVKKKVQQQGANATFQSARKAVMALQVQDNITKNIAKAAGVKPSGKKRPVVSKLGDVKLAITELNRLKVFDLVPGRQYEGFKDMKDVFSNVKADQLCAWLSAKKAEASFDMV